MNFTVHVLYFTFYEVRIIMSITCTFHIQCIMGLLILWLFSCVDLILYYIIKVILLQKLLINFSLLHIVLLFCFDRFFNCNTVIFDSISVNLIDLRYLYILVVIIMHFFIFTFRPISLKYSICMLQYY